MRETKKSGSRLRPRLPKFATLEEERAFWDTHSVTDFPDEWAVVEEPIELEPTLAERIKRRHVKKRLLPLYLEQGQWSRVQQLARTKRVTPQALVRRWIREKLAS